MGKHILSYGKFQQGIQRIKEEKGTEDDTPVDFNIQTIFKIKLVLKMLIIFLNINSFNIAFYS